MNQRNAVFPANRHALYETHGYSAAIASGDLLFVSGQVGSRSDGSPEPDFAEQVRLAFSNLEATLAAGGCTFDDIVDVTTICGCWSMKISWLFWGVRTSVYLAISFVSLFGHFEATMK